MSHPILVFGALGNVGAEVVQALIAQLFRQTQVRLPPIVAD